MEFLGVGAYCSCYRLGGYAIKMLNANSEQKHVDRFNEEVQILHTLAHFNIVRSYQGNDGLLQALRENYTQDQPFLILEYCPGQSLSHCIKTRRHCLEHLTHAAGYILTVDETWNVIRQMAQALLYLKSQGIVHRDIKPKNILLMHDSPLGTIKLCDFGLSIKIGPDEMCKGRSGTPAYMAPEVVKNQPHDWQADVWSLGVTAFQCLTGTLPFGHEACCKYMIYACIEKGEWSWPSWVNDGELKQCIEAMLQTNQFDRIEPEQLINK